MNKNILIIILVLVIILAGVIYFIQTKNTQFYQLPLNNTPPTENSPQQKVINITISNFAFSPNIVTAKVGDTITWTNQDAMPHKISGSGISSDILQKGQSYSTTFTASGTFDYICSIHPSMKGQIIIQ